MLCNATEVGPITFSEKMSFSTLTHLCKSFGSNVIVIENHTSLLQALELTENINCKYCLIYHSSMSGSSHIRRVLIGVEYRNCHLTLDVYLLFAIWMGQIQSKLIKNTCNL